MLKKRLKIGVIFGGRSPEHEVSLVSAESVMKALDKKKYKIIEIGITKQGKWICGKNALEALKLGTKKDIEEVILPPDPGFGGLIRLKDKKRIKLDCIFPVLHGPFGEDGTVQGLLDLACLPYVGAGVLGSSIGIDKIVQKNLFIQAGLPVVKFIWFDRKSEALKKLISIEKKIGYPCFVKPVCLGSSVGISKVNNKKELIWGIKIAFGYDQKILIEQGIDAREIECSVLGNEHPKASLPGEIIPSREFYDYKAKYVDGKSKVLAPVPNLSQRQIKKIQKLAILSFKACQGSGMARIDFLLEKNTSKVYVSEINTIPGFTSISMYPKLWQVSGLPYPKLLDKLIKLALKRYRQKSKLETLYHLKKKWYRK